MTTTQRSENKATKKTVFCAGCPQRGAFYAITKALGRDQKALFAGELGCLKLGTSASLDTIDTVFDLDPIVSVDQEIASQDSAVKKIMFVSDTTFFSSAKDDIARAVEGKRDITIAVLNNDLASVMGVLPDQDTDQDMNDTETHNNETKAGSTRGKDRDAQSMADMSATLRDELMAMGVMKITKANPLFADKAIAAARDALKYKGPSAVIFESSCTRLTSKKPPVYFIANACAGCRKCVTTIGCPALGWSEVGHTIVIDRDQCTGCGLCTDICEYGVITCPTRPRVRPVIPPRSRRLPSDDGSLSRFPTASELS